MKVIEKTWSGKTTFVSTFTEFLIKYIPAKFKIFLISPTSHQRGWDRIRHKFTVVNAIEEIRDAFNYLIITDVSQIQFKGNKTLTEMLLNKRHKNIFIIQCEQYTQATDIAKKWKMIILFCWVFLLSMIVNTLLKSVYQVLSQRCFLNW